MTILILDNGTLRAVTNRVPPEPVRIFHVRMEGDTPGHITRLPLSVNPGMSNAWIQEVLELGGEGSQ